MFEFRENYQAGIDITTEKISACLLCFKKNSINVEKTLALKYQKNDDQSLLNALIEIRKQLPKNTKIVTGLKNENFLIRELSLDANLNDDEILLYLKHQADDLFGYHEESLYFDYSRLEKCDGEQTIQAIVAHQKPIKNIIRLFKLAKLNIDVIDINHYARLRAWRYSIHIFSFAMMFFARLPWSFFILQEQLFSFAIKEITANNCHTALGLALWKK